jgi:argininosuccinate lyase
MERGQPLSGLSDEECLGVDPALTPEVRGVLGAERAVAAFCSYGSTAPAEVARQVAQWQLKLGLAARAADGPLHPSPTSLP